MSYLEFKLTLEMNHIDTFEKDHKVQAFKVLDTCPITTKMDSQHWQKLLSLTHDLKEHIYKYTSFISMIQIRYTSNNANIENLDKVIQKANLDIEKYTGLPVDNKKDGE